MKNRMGIIILVVITVGLCIGLIWSQKQAVEQKTVFVDRVTDLSNKLTTASVSLEKQLQVNSELESDRTKQKEAFDSLTNHYSEVSANLEKTESALKSTQEQVAQRDAKISDLESQNQALDQRALDLSISITNLTSQIDDTKRRLAASEGDKAFLEKELQRLITEKAELEKQFNDLAVLRAQVAKLKEELNISRRLEWIRKGLFASSEQKGAEQLMQKGAPPVNTQQAKQQPAYDLNVEVSADGTVKVIPPLTNAPVTPNTSPAAK
jgi:chromosome segregation ATPase